jgi:hypothetical protein
MVYNPTRDSALIGGTSKLQGEGVRLGPFFVAFDSTMTETVKHYHAMLLAATSVAVACRLQYESTIVISFVDSWIVRRRKVNDDFEATLAAPFISLLHCNSGSRARPLPS